MSSVERALAIVLPSDTLNLWISKGRAYLHSSLLDPQARLVWRAYEKNVWYMVPVTIDTLHVCMCAVGKLIAPFFSVFTFCHVTELNLYPAPLRYRKKFLSYARVTSQMYCKFARVNSVHSTLPNYSCNLIGILWSPYIYARQTKARPQSMQEKKGGLGMRSLVSRL